MWPLIIEYICLLLFIAALAKWWTMPKIKLAFRVFGRDAIQFRNDAVRASILPLVGASAIIGVLMSVIKHDWRWLIVVGGIAFLLGSGLVLRWVIYDRWITALLPTLEGLDRLKTE
jgi:hypothetical protein